jgi:LCP family protein required for cell wall assembly
VSDADPISIRASSPDGGSTDGPTEGPGSGSAGRPKRRAPVRKRHTVAKVLTTTTIVMALVVGLSVSYFYRQLNANLTAGDGFVSDVPLPDVIEVEGPKQPLNVLIMGSDSRDGAGNNIDGLTESGARSDTTILLHVSANRKRAYGISIPRDTMVNRPECKTKKETIPPANYVIWNAAFSEGGAACTIQQFQAISNVRLQHYVVVDFNGFRDMVDAIDGVEVCIPEEVNDEVGNISLKAGKQTLQGQDALDYVRVRHDLGDGSDLSRAKRQQAFIASMANKIVSADTLARPDRLLFFLNAATKSLEVDKKLDSVTKLADLGTEFVGIGLDKVQFFTIPFAGDPQDPNRVILAPEAAEVWDRLRKDEIIPNRLKAGLIRASTTPEGGEKDKGSSGSASADPNTETVDTADSEAEAAERLRVGLCA